MEELRTLSRSRSRPRHRQTDTDFDSPILHFPSRLPLSQNNPWKAWAKESFGAFPIVIKVNYFALTALAAIGLRFPESEGRGQYKRWHPDILRDLSDAECSSSFVCTMVMEPQEAFLRGPNGFAYIGIVMEFLDRHCDQTWKIRLPYGSYELRADMPKQPDVLVPSSKKLSDFLYECNSSWRQNNVFHVSLRAIPQIQFIQREMQRDSSDTES